MIQTGSAAAADSRPSVAPLVRLRYLLWAVLALYAASTIRSIVHLIPKHRISDVIMGPWYYLDYSDGFVRRALPGALLKLTFGPSDTSVEAVGWSLSFVGALAVVFIAIRIGAVASRPGAGLLATTLVVIAPLGITTVIRDPGRSDSIGMLAMAAMLLVATARRPSLALAVGVAALGTAIAVASQEFLLAFLAPVVVSLIYVALRAQTPARAPGFTKRWATFTLIALLPGIALAMASALTKPSAAYLQNLDERSHPQTCCGASWELRHSLFGVWSWVLHSRGIGPILLSSLVWLAVYCTTVIVLRVVLGRLGRWYWLSAACFALLAAMSVAALDVRRWWTLGMVGHLAVTAILASHDPPVREESNAWAPRVARYVIPLAFVVALYGQSLPNTVRPREDGWYSMSYYVGPLYAERFIPFWFQGFDQQ